MAVNLTGQAGRARAATLLESSFAQFQADRGVVGLARQVRNAAARPGRAGRGDELRSGRLRRVRALRRCFDRPGGGSVPGTGRAPAGPRRRGPCAQLRRGDVIRVPGGRRAGLAVVLDPGLHRPGGRRRPPAIARAAVRGHAAQAGPARRPGTAAESPARSAGAHRQPPGQAAGRGGLPGAGRGDRQDPDPGSFSPRSPQHRRDLAATVRNRLASRPGRAARRRAAPARAADWEHTAPEDRRTTSRELRRRLRRHPCHGCPDREDHAR